MLLLTRAYTQRLMRTPTQFEVGDMGIDCSGHAGLLIHSSGPLTARLVLYGDSRLCSGFQKVRTRRCQAK